MIRRKYKLAVILPEQ